MSNFFTRSVGILFVVGTSSVVALACSSSSTDPATSGGYTLDNVCTQIPAKICASRKGCCEKSGIGYDAKACETKEKANCDKDVAEVKAGTMAFNPANIDACLAKFSTFLDKCTLTIDDSLKVFSDLEICKGIFAGKLAVGATCERSNQCVPPPPGSFGDCNGAKKRCTVNKAGAAGDTCSFGGDSDTNTLCNTGLYCDVDFTKMPIPPGTCKTALKLGDACEGTKPFACGLGSYCDGTAKKCTVSKAAGSACASALECSSFECGAADKKCTTPKPIVDSVECKGT